MTNQTFSSDADRAEVVTEDTITVIKQGPIGRALSTVWNYKGTILASIAVGGAGYLAYDAIKSGRAEKAAEHVADASAALAKLA